ncbi:hypothetical protein BTGOE5_22310 [Bacillus thuringiensis]|nr:hypothetical protein IIS_02212 [Bacillus cereus VD131]OFC99788.1 hypothetical protein BTGOE5_22310 [Bacillus thuringiensis]OFD07731.1 hypothetical protein BTGOE7_23400 [Bacillus thuringiensis]
MISEDEKDIGQIVEEMLLNPENVQRIVIQVMPDGTIVKKILEV